MIMITNFFIFINFLVIVSFLTKLLIIGFFFNSINSSFSNDIVNEYNNTYHNTIKMNPTSVKSSTFSDFNAEKNDKD